MASKAERQENKERSAFAADYREKAARKRSKKDNQSDSDSDSDSNSDLDPETNETPPARKKSRPSKNSADDSITADTSALTAELSRINEACLAAQLVQNTTINALLEREVTVSENRIEEEKKAAVALAAHRTAELEFQKQKAEDDKVTRDKIVAIESKINNIDSALSLLLHHTVGPDARP